MILNPDEADLLKWLASEDYSQYGECHGRVLDSLISYGLAQLHNPGEHQHFIANDFAGNKGIMFQAVSLTDLGRMIHRIITTNAKQRLI